MRTILVDVLLLIHAVEDLVLDPDLLGELLREGVRVGGTALQEQGLHVVHESDVYLLRRQQRVRAVQQE